MEQQILESIFSKESIFAVLFVYMLVRQIKHQESQQNENKHREEKLYTFLDDMKTEFAKLVNSYERLSNDVEDIRQDLQEHKNKGG